MKRSRLSGLKIVSGSVFSAGRAGVSIQRLYNVYWGSVILPDPCGSGVRYRYIDILVYLIAMLHISFSMLLCFFHNHHVCVL